MTKIKVKRKKLFEDDQPVQQTQQPVQQTQQPVQQTQQPLQQPQQTQQPVQQTQQTVQQTQQPAQQQQQTTQQQSNQYVQKVADLLKKMENIYWMISVNLPDEIQKEIPDFKQGNTLADSTIKLWNDFKAAPDEQKFNMFIESFKNFGNTPVNTNTEQQAVNAGLKAAYSFNKKLMENLNIANKQKYYNSVIEDYFDKTEFTIY